MHWLQRRRSRQQWACSCSDGAGWGSTPQVNVRPLLPPAPKPQSQRAIAAAAVQWGEHAANAQLDMLDGEACSESIRRSATAWAQVDHSTLHDAAKAGGDAGGAEDLEIQRVARAVRQFRGWAQVVAAAAQEAWSAQTRHELATRWRCGLAALVLTGGASRARAAREGDLGRLG